MKEIAEIKHALTSSGFTTIENLYSAAQVERIIAIIEGTDKTKATFRKSADLFAIRQFLKEVPETIDLIFNEQLKSFVRQLLGKDYFVVKSIYFDKPAASNWYVSYHQDLTISVDKKLLLTGFGPWTVKQNQFAVQPPVEFLENISTIRIHLDETNENNGALRVIPQSHLHQIYRAGKNELLMETAESCNVELGGLMVMKPLLLHSSGRTTNNKKRRVIHIEFSNKELPAGLNWAERLDL